MSKRLELVLCGNGGQGIILAGVILADAAATHDGLEAAQSQAYGPAARSGSCKAEVVISDEPIDYPKVNQADVLLAMSQDAYEEYRGQLKPDGLLIVDSTQVEPDEDEAVAVPLTRLAEEETGHALSANIVALGVLVGLTGVISQDALRAALASRAPRAALEMNSQALEAGLRQAVDLKAALRSLPFASK